MRRVVARLTRYGLEPRNDRHASAQLASAPSLPRRRSCPYLGARIARLVQLYVTSVSEALTRRWNLQERRDLCLELKRARTSVRAS